MRQQPQYRVGQGLGDSPLYPDGLVVRRGQGRALVSLGNVEFLVHFRVHALPQPVDLEAVVAEAARLGGR